MPLKQKTWVVDKALHTREMKSIWEEILINTPFSHVKGKKEIDYQKIEAILEKEAQGFLADLRRYKRDHPFFFFDEKQILQTYIFAYAIHSPQERESGESYIVHPENVVIHMLDIIGKAYREEQEPWDLTPEIMVALLHDTTEDAWMSKYYEVYLLQQGGADVIARVKKEFPKRVERYFSNLFHPSIVEKVEHMVRKKKELADSDVGGKAVRDITDLLSFYDRHVHHQSFIEEILKISDRIHNLLTLGGLPWEKTYRIAGGTLLSFIPMALRLGLHRVAEEITDICLQYLLGDVWQTQKLEAVTLCETEARKLYLKYPYATVEVRLHLVEGIDVETITPSMPFEKMTQKVPLYNIAVVFHGRRAFDQSQRVLSQLRKEEGMLPLQEKKGSRNMLNPEKRVHENTITIDSAGRKINITVLPEEIDRIHEHGHIEKKEEETYISVIKYPCSCKGLPMDLIFRLVKSLTHGEA